MSLKKYLNVFRPLLACRWIERLLGQVPMLFAHLVEGVLLGTNACTRLPVRAQASPSVARMSPAGQHR